MFMMGFYMTMIAFDRIISSESGQLLLMIPIQIYKTLYARIRPDQIKPGDIQVNVKQI